MTIKLRLVLLIATGLLTALIMSLAGYLGNTRMADAVQDNDVSMTVLRNHMEADMMHDALRADVLSAMLVGLGKSTSTPAEVNSSIKEHAEHFREVLAENLKLPLDASIKASLEKSNPAWTPTSAPASASSPWPWRTPRPHEGNCRPSMPRSASWKNKWQR